MSNPDPHPTYGDTADAACIKAERLPGHVLVIRIARPEKRNALSNPMVVEIGRLLAGARDDFDIRCVVITGAETISPPAPTSKIFSSMA